MGLVAPQHVGSSRTKDQTCVSYIGRQIPYHWATREVLYVYLLTIWSSYLQTVFSHFPNIYIYIFSIAYLGFPDGTSCKESTYQCRWHKRCEFDPWMRKIPWRRAWQPTPVFLSGESHGQRSLASYNPWGRRVRHGWSNLANKHSIFTFLIRNDRSEIGQLSVHPWA